MSQQSDNEKISSEEEYRKFIINDLRATSLLIAQLKKLHKHPLLDSMSEVVEAIQTNTNITQQIPKGAKELLKAVSDVTTFLQNPTRETKTSLDQAYRSVESVQTTLKNNASNDSSLEIVGLKFLKALSGAMMVLDILSGEGNPSALNDFWNNEQLYDVVSEAIDENKSNVQIYKAANKFRQDLEQVRPDDLIKPPSDIAPASESPFKKGPS